MGGIESYFPFPVPNPKTRETKDDTYENQKDEKRTEASDYYEMYCSFEKPNDKEIAKPKSPTDADLKLFKKYLKGAVNSELVRHWNTTWEEFSYDESDGISKIAKQVEEAENAKQADPIFLENNLKLQQELTVLEANE